jgi:hypothetical protein
MHSSAFEYTAEDLIAHKLQRQGILVAKPRFDIEGADLLAILQVRDGARFARVQCKGRTLLQGSRSEIAVRKQYVTPGFVVFLFIETQDLERTYLYCFFQNDIIHLFKPRNEELTLSLKASAFASELKPYEAHPVRVELLKSIIPEVLVDEEFQRLVSVQVAATGGVRGIVSASVNANPER